MTAQKSPHETPPHPQIGEAQPKKTANRHFPWLGWFCVAAVGALAVAWFADTLHHGPRSDDYLAVYYRDRVSGSVNWGRIFEEFARPWFNVPNLYRPLVSVSLGLDDTLMPGPFGGHLWNVVMLALGAGATTATAWRLMPSHGCRGAAALVAGGLVVFHPAAIEATAWIAGRTSSMQLAFAMLSGWLYLRHVQGDGRRWPFALTTALAVLTREGGVMIPVSLLMLDLLATSNRRLRDRWSALAPAVFVVLGYLVLRTIINGAPGPVTVTATLMDRIQNVVVYLGQLFMPPSVDGVANGWNYLVLLACIPSIVIGLGLRAIWLPIWIVLMLGPTSHMPAESHIFHGRLLFDAVPVLGIALAFAVATPLRNLGTRLLTTLAACGALVTMAIPSAAWLDRYGADDQVARAVESALVEASATATADAPLACVRLPYLPIFHQRLWGVLGLEPFAPRDLPVLGLPEILNGGSEGSETFADAAPLHAILAAGGRAVSWNPTNRALDTLAATATGSVVLATSETNPRQFLAKQTWPGTAVAALKFQTPSAGTTPAPWDLRFRLLDDVPGKLNYSWQSVRGTGDSAWFDATHAVAPMLLAGLGAPFRGIEIEWKGGDPPTDLTVEVVGALRVKPSDAPTLGREMRVAEFMTALTPPISTEPMRLYLMLPTGVRHMDSEMNSPFELSADLQDHLGFAVDIFAPVRATWFWQSCHADGQEPWTTGLEHAVLVR